MDVTAGYRLLDGKGTAEAVRARVRAEVEQVKRAKGRAPHLAAVLVGNDGASRTYVESKVRACASVGFRSTLVELPATISQEELMQQVAALNTDPALDGFIVQLPLPAHIDEQAVTLAIDPRKDVDGFHPVNLGHMVLGLPGFLPATPAGVVEMLRHHQVPTAGKHCVVVGRSNIVGKPMAILMARNADPGNCTVTIAHSRTKDLAAITRQADILIVAIGKPRFITADMVKEGAVVVDVGIHRIDDPARKSGFRLVGDVDFEQVAPKCSWISPVPGGVGPMTIASLLQNTLIACQR
ncbi:MAG: bifunctional methylenetetrahydrofolate dehydrogenase/methenyltetrahydrofolate cyclohydrolase FolD [Flavobacteriales bacterium]|jgi:methylenetetrahydrofolate dehydrogenase (NADP+)/methenyltetrahydrofolate cyclohydrolase|nr:bifunctional methylenetetrahydrofolate dehydrogenase/methenyltetrahydrofolate cyclohydrolase FolD [Flavobacteriales bacterium]